MEQLSNEAHGVTAKAGVVESPEAGINTDVHGYSLKPGDKKG